MYGEDLMSSSLDYYGSTASSAADIATQADSILGIIATMGAVIGVVALVMSVLSVIANWKIFKKAGEKGWKSIVPIYNMITLFKIAGVSPLLILGYFAAVIPTIGALVCLGITIYVYYKLAKAFGKDAGFTIGLVLLGTIFMLILAFGKSEYQLNKQTTENFDATNQ